MWDWFKKKRGRRKRKPKRAKRKSWLDSLFKKAKRTNRRTIKRTIRQPRKLRLKKNTINYRSFLRSRLFNAVLMVIVVYMVYLTGRESLVNFYQSKEMIKVETENSVIRQRNQQLFYLLEYYKTETYAELEARKHLNLRKPGEKVAVVNVDMVDVGKSLDKQDNEEVEERENYEKWWDFVFADLSQLPSE